MIEKKTVEALAKEWLADKEYFLVDVDVTADDRIVVEIDHKDGVWIDDCADLSRYIESRLDRDAEDYELEVGSAGVGQPFKVVQQYVNCIGQDVEVMTAEGRKVQGTLTAVNAPRFTVTTHERRRLEGQKRPQVVDEEREFVIGEVKYTKYILNFK